MVNHNCPVCSQESDTDAKSHYVCRTCQDDANAANDELRGGRISQGIRRNVGRPKGTKQIHDRRVSTSVYLSPNETRKLKQIGKSSNFSKALQRLAEVLTRLG